MIYGDFFSTSSSFEYVVQYRVTYNWWFYSRWKRILISLSIYTVVCGRIENIVKSSSVKQIFTNPCKGCHWLATRKRNVKSTHKGKVKCCHSHLKITSRIKVLVNFARTSCEKLMARNTQHSLTKSCKPPVVDKCIILIIHVIVLQHIV